MLDYIRGSDMKSREDIWKLLNSLSKTKFRGSFHLNSNMKEYVLEKGMDKIREDAYQFIRTRIAPKNPKNDGKQTPMRANSHPIFIAQHACGCCCRSCLERIHHISKNKELSDAEVDYIVTVLLEWVRLEVNY